MSRRDRLAALATAALFLAAAAPAAAQTTYTGTGAAATTAAADFAAAIGPSTLEDFEARADGELTSEWTYGAGETAGLSNGFGVTSTYPFGGGPISGLRGYGAYPEGGVGGDPVFAFTAPLRAFGLYIVDVEVADALIFTLAGGGTRTYALAAGDSGGVTFFGVDFGSNAITGVTLDLAFDDAVLIDDVRIATGGVPEPSAWALLIAGFGVVGASLRSRRRATAGA